MCLIFQRSDPSETTKSILQRRLRWLLLEGCKAPRSPVSEFLTKAKEQTCLWSTPTEDTVWWGLRQVLGEWRGRISARTSWRRWRLPALPQRTDIIHRGGMKSLPGSEDVEENTHLQIHGGVQGGFTATATWGEEERNVGCASTCGYMRHNLTQEGHLTGLKGGQPLFTRQRWATLKSPRTF